MCCFHKNKTLNLLHSVICCHANILTKMRVVSKISKYLFDLFKIVFVFFTVTFAAVDDIDFVAVVACTDVADIFVAVVVFVVVDFPFVVDIVAFVRFPLTEINAISFSALLELDASCFATNKKELYSSNVLAATTAFGSAAASPVAVMAYSSSRTLECVINKRHKMPLANVFLSIFLKKLSFTQHQRLNRTEFIILFSTLRSTFISNQLIFKNSIQKRK